MAQPNTVVSASHTPIATPTMGHALSVELPGILVFAAIGDNRIDLVDRLVAATQSYYSFYSTTPLGFFKTK